jgi:hypothetical protein
MYLQKVIRKNVGKKIFFVGLWKVTDEKREPSPFVIGTDPRIRIRIRSKMSRIRNTTWKMILEER